MNNIIWKRESFLEFMIIFRNEIIVQYFFCAELCRFRYDDFLISLQLQDQ